MRRLISHYRDIPGPIWRLVAASQLLTLVNVVLMLVFNLYLRSLGHDDTVIARINSYRFIAVLALALPVGMLVRGRRLKPLLLVAATMIPLATWLMLAFADAHRLGALHGAVFLWGIGMMALQVAGLTFIVRETPIEQRAEAISLNFATFSIAMVICGLLVPALSALGRLQIGPWLIVFDDGGIIRVLVLLSTLALPLVWTLRETPPPVDERPLLSRGLAAYDWPLIARVVAPNLLIATGAGLTIPFINLFFNSVFALEAHQFSMLGGVAGVLVLTGSLLNPSIKRRFGYRVAILLSQSLAVSFLVLLALTELYRELPGMLGVAMVCYLLRQPLMNMANPITSELSMSYVGPRNQELIAALHASVWSGSWFLSARLFQLLRTALLPYWQIFLVTAALYSIGIGLYASLIRANERREASLAAL